MRKILITGATGNVGKAALPHLLTAIDAAQTELIGTVRTADIEAEQLPTGVRPLLFDFENPARFHQTLTGVHTFFLLRPPQLANVKKTFQPLIQAAQKAQVKYIVFLSVQGVEKSSLIPHFGIEKLIRESGIAYTFLRPAYFMQNFTTTLLHDIQLNDRIFLPAGNAPFTVVDLEDVGKVAAEVMLHPEKHVNQAYDLTNQELLTFGEMATELTQQLQRKITYESPNLWRFFLQKRQEKVPVMLILVMIMLHYFPRFQSPPPVSKQLEEIIGKAPQTFAQFVARNLPFWEKI